MFESGNFSISVSLTARLEATILKHACLLTSNHFLVWSLTEYDYRPFRMTWITLSIRDRSAFNLSLAYAVLFWDQKCGVPSVDFMDNTESVKYYSRSLTQLNSRLGDDIDRISEGVISTILGLACNHVCLTTNTLRKCHG